MSPQVVDVRARVLHYAPDHSALRVLFGAETGRFFALGTTCRDCGTRLGQVHTLGCPAEVCPRTGHWHTLADCLKTSSATATLNREELQVFSHLPYDSGSAGYRAGCDHVAAGPGHPDTIEEGSA